MEGERDTLSEQSRRELCVLHVLVVAKGGQRRFEIDLFVSKISPLVVGWVVTFSQSGRGMGRVFKVKPVGRHFRAASVVKPLL